MSTTATSPRRKRIATAFALTGLISLGAWAALSTGVFSGTASTAGSTSAASQDAPPPGKPALQRDGQQPYIVLFREAPLAGYRGGMGIASPRNPRSDRIEVKGKAARDYVQYLQTRQRDHEVRIGRAIGRSLQVSLRMQHAVNGIVTVLSEDEAARVRKQADVMLVEGYREYEADTDTGPALIGAKAVWNGVPSTIGSGTNQAKGEGVVVGILDSGINFGSPSFAATDPVDGYVHVNPNGSGTFLGTCAPGNVDEGRCNDKLIGGHDFVCGAPANRCGVANIAEEPGFGDTNGHGSHTASTVAGNERDVTYRGANARISGVAPRANIIAYDICYTEISTGRGLCPNVSSVAAVNQAMADGVEVINFSIGGGTSPWTDAVSLAFLNAVDAGVYVAASAGNSGPGAGTLGHNEPWVASTAAAQHGRQGFDFFLSITGPVAAPELAAVALTPGSGGVDLTANIPGTTPIVLMPGTAPGAGIDGPSDGCTAYPAGTFAGAVAVIRRGTCSFAIKANFARDAGAIAVIIANNQPGITTPSVPGTTIPVFLVTQVNGNAIRDYYVANGGATGAIPYPATVTANTVDALGAFSSRGPAAFDVLKPDITAPGVNVLATYAGNTITGFENAISLLSGTSMASPHQAGAAALLRQLNPTWSVPEIKSALMMTARQSVLLEDQVTPANAFAAGAGRVQVDLATRAGLVMHETKARYLAANPGAGGDPSLLNQPSMAAARCIDFCTFTRTVRSTLSYKHQWKLSATGLGAQLSTDILTLKPGESRQITVTIDNRGHPGDGSWRFGTLVLTPHQAGHGAQALPVLHMPIAVSVPPPPPPSTPLANGVPVSGLSGAAGSQSYYRLDVPAGASSLTFTLQGGTGDADLFVKRGFEPNDVIFDCVSAGATSNETCSFTAPQAGTWFVRIVAFSAYSGVTLTGTYQ